MIKYVIDKDILRENINVIKSMAGSTPIIAVLKCNGYGLGTVEFARFLLYRGIEIFAVSDLSEALTLRKAGFTNEIILLSSNAVEEDNEEIVKNDIIATVGSVEAAKALSNAGKKLDKKPKAHLKINTGMGRYGFDADDISWVNEIRDLNIEFSGTFTHFSMSFSKNEKDVLNQLSKFKSSIKNLNKAGFETGVIHAANSHAFLKYPKTHLDSVRIGSAFLGRVADAKAYGLGQIGYLESKVTDINYLKKGENIGYGNTFKAKKDMKIAIIPVGYFNGFGTEKAKDTFRLRDRIRYVLEALLPKKKYVKIGGNVYKLVGRVATLNVIADVTGSDVKAGDTAILSANPLLVDSGVEREFKGTDL